MRKVQVMLLATVAFALTPGAASATHSKGVGPKHDFVHGTGNRRVELSTGTSNQRVHVNAMSGPAGENPQGHFFMRITIGQTETVDISGFVTCLNVEGNLAVAMGVIDESETPDFPAGETNFRIDVLDNGEPGSQSKKNPDLFNVTLGTGGVPIPPTDCPLFDPPNVEISHGNFLVHDAAP